MTSKTGRGEKTSQVPVSAGALDGIRQAVIAISRLLNRPGILNGIRAAENLAKDAEYAVAAKHSRAERPEIGMRPMADLCP